MKVKPSSEVTVPITGKCSDLSMNSLCLLTETVHWKIWAFNSHCHFWRWFKMAAVIISLIKNSRHYFVTRKSRATKDRQINIRCLLSCKCFLHLYDIYVSDTRTFNFSGFDGFDFYLGRWIRMSRLEGSRRGVFYWYVECWFRIT